MTVLGQIKSRVRSDYLDPTVVGTVDLDVAEMRLGPDLSVLEEIYSAKRPASI